jgi:hypothetical protein
MTKVDIDFWNTDTYHRSLSLQSHHADKNRLFTILNVWMSGETTILFPKLQALYMEGGWFNRPSWSPTLLHFCDLVTYYSKPSTLSITRVHLPENGMPHLLANLALTSLTLGIGIDSDIPSLSLPNLRRFTIRFENRDYIDPL